MEIAVRQLLIEKQITTADEVRREVEAMDNRTPAHGGRVVARAWTDPDFRQLLLEDGNAACEAMGLERGLYKLVAVENTDKAHNSALPEPMAGAKHSWRNWSPETR